LMKDAWVDNDSSELQISKLCQQVMAQPIWGADLTKYPQLTARVNHHLYSIASLGIMESLKRIEAGVKV